MNRQKLLDEGWIDAGTIGVDSGQVMVCDPCYVLKEDGEGPPETTYRAVCDANINPDGYPNYGPIPYRMGHDGCAVKCSSGFGDGTYHVYVKIEDFQEWGKRVVAMMVDFDNDSNEEEEG